MKWERSLHFFALQSTPGRLFWENRRDCQEGSDERDDKRQHETTCESIQDRDDFESYVQICPAGLQTV